MSDQLIQEIREKILAAYNDYKDGRYQYMLDGIEKRYFKNQHTFFLKTQKAMSCENIIGYYVWSLYHKTESSTNAFISNSKIGDIIFDLIDEIVKEDKEEKKENDKLPFNGD